jgi:osmotically-inducible protein OsmY
VIRTPVRVDADEAIQLDVLAELKWDPLIDPEEVGVSVEDGIVTLNGSLDSYPKKIAAERAAHRVRGVKAVVNELEVRLPGPFLRTDEDIARSVVQTLKWTVHVPDEAVEVTVADGWVTLKGEVPWQYQKDEAEQAIHRLVGIKGLTNLIRTHPNIKPAEVRQQIEEALVRSAETDARHIRVEVEDGKVILKGNVRTWTEREDAKRAAWSAPGVQAVEDRLAIMA